MPGTTAPVQYMLGGMPFRKGRVAFDFNFTFTRNSSHPLRHIGLLAVHDRDAFIREIAIHDNLRIITQEGINVDQEAQFKANSDFGSVSVPLKIVTGGLSTGALIAIIIGGIIVLVGGGYLLYKWNLGRKQKVSKSL